MANCLLNRDRLKSTSCGYSLNQVVEIYLANYEDVTSVEIGKPASMTGATDCGMEVTSITMAAGKKFYKIEPNKDSASFTDALATGDAGSKYRVQTLNFSIGGAYDPAGVCDIEALSLGRFLAVAKLSSGNYILMGNNVPLEATQADLIGSAEATGFNGIQVVLSANTTESALPLSAEAIESLTTPGA